MRTLEKHLSGAISAVSLPSSTRQSAGTRSLLGEQERLAFARLLHKPGWVFLDEATAALDEDSQRRVIRLFDDELSKRPY